MRTHAKWRQPKVTSGNKKSGQPKRKPEAPLTPGQFRKLEQSVKNPALNFENLTPEELAPHLFNPKAYGV